MIKSMNHNSLSCEQHMYEKIKSPIAQMRFVHVHVSAMSHLSFAELTFLFPLPSSLGPAELVAACAWLWERGEEIIKVKTWKLKTETNQLSVLLILYIYSKPVLLST